LFAAEIISGFCCKNGSALWDCFESA